MRIEQGSKKERKRKRLTPVSCGQASTFLCLPFSLPLTLYNFIYYIFPSSFLSSLSSSDLATFCMFSKDSSISLSINISNNLSLHSKQGKVWLIHLHYYAMHSFTHDSRPSIVLQHFLIMTMTTCSTLCFLQLLNLQYTGKCMDSN